MLYDSWHEQNWRQVHNECLLIQRCMLTYRQATAEHWHLQIETNLTSANELSDNQQRQHMHKWVANPLHIDAHDSNSISRF